jgi:hypothetical protein
MLAGCCEVEAMLLVLLLAFLGLPDAGGVSDGRVLIMARRRQGGAEMAESVSRTSHSGRRVAGNGAACMHSTLEEQLCVAGRRDGW